MEVELKVYGKYLEWASMKFKHKIEKCYKTVFANIQKNTIILLGISATVTITTGIILGIDYFAFYTFK